MVIKGGIDSELGSMSETTRKLVFSVMGQEPHTLPILHMIYMYTRCDDILSWLWRNSITGQRLIDFLRFEHNNSPQSMAKYVLGRIEHTKKDKILYGIDFKK